MWKNQFVGLAKYNQNMNLKMFATAAKLNDVDLFRDQSAYFKSVWGTLHHIYAADLIWLRRYKNIPGAETLLAPLDQFPAVISFEPNLYTTLSDLALDRKKLDQLICDFFRALPEFHYTENLKYQNMAQEEHDNKLWLLFTHFFNHQTHHRGQATTLLSQCGHDVGVTDLSYVISESL